MNNKVYYVRNNDLFDTAGMMTKKKIINSLYL